MRPIIDTHLDLAWSALGWGRDLTLELDALNRGESALTDDDARGHATVSLPELRRAGVAVCLATVLARVRPEAGPDAATSRLSVDHPCPGLAYAAAQGQMAYYRFLAAQGELRVLRTAADLRDHWQRWQDTPAGSKPLGIILAMEGADPIASPAQAGAWWDDGMRVISLAHYGPSRYAVGTGATGPLTPEGASLLAEMERLGMVLDVTHLAEPGFWEALDRFGGPVLASHNNCRALVPGDRQFSDDQLRRLLARGAVIGVAMDAWMLLPGWQTGKTHREAVGLEAVADHVDHLCQLAGDCRHVGIGSDLDGGFGHEQTPHGLDSIADLQKLGALLADRRYSDAQIDAVFHGNWLRFFLEHLPDGSQ